ncbi:MULTISPECIES: helix-turn-helix domain-containing protein [Pseudomonas]|uniref:helix-turn-helix domain-containing protein n=1 Tax=Pseudomonas TaxID=286 RepID=UPI0012FDF148|nr:helix-turn-helix transcriptional regulator [Pseudomonas sp. Irchel 3F5]
MLKDRLKQALELKCRGKRYALAVEIGVHPSSVGRWLQGGPITVENLVQIATALDISLDWLVLGRDGGCSKADALSSIEGRLLAELRLMSPASIEHLAVFVESLSQGGRTGSAGPAREIG